MNPSPVFSDQELMAYADGELPADQALRIRTQALDDAQLRERIAAFKATGRDLSRLFDAQLKAPLPAALQSLLAEPPSASGRVLPLRPPPARRWTHSLTALAASLILTLGFLLWRGLPPAGPDSPAFLQTAAFSAVLERTPSGEPVVLLEAGENYEILPTASLRGSQGYCRRFTHTQLPQGETGTALACRDGGAVWRVQQELGTEWAARPDNEYRPAAGAGASEAVLSPAEERRLIESAWSMAQ